MNEPTRLAVLTPDGRGAIAVVRVWGPEAVALADAAFRPARGPGLAGSAPGRLRFGRIGAGEGDEVVAVRTAGERSEVEVQCHGGPAAVGLVVEALTAVGAIASCADDWGHARAAGPIEAEAWLDLARAPTVRTAAILLDQARGALSAELQRLAALERSVPEAAKSGRAVLIRRSAVGLRLVTGWSVALAGRPNVGKSRLLNAVAGFDRAIVDPTPGTTRDVVTLRTALDGWPVELADTAGLRPTADPIEAAGVDRARRTHAGADLVLLVLDRSEPLTATDRELIAAHSAAIIVANKSDLPAAWELDLADVTVSAERGDGLDGLVALLATRLVPEPPSPGAAVPFREGQLGRIEEDSRLQNSRFQQGDQFSGSTPRDRGEGG